MSQRRTLFVLMALFALLLSACGQATPAAPSPSAEASTAPIVATTTTLNVFAAASLTTAFQEIATAFEAANPGVTVVYNFAGSQQLANQINEGAPADVFASANLKQMDVVIASGMVASGQEQNFAQNQLVLILPKENPAAVQTLADLTKPGLKLVLADKATPIGQYTLDVLSKASELPEYGATYAEAVLANVVSYEDDVRSVLTKVRLGEADAGILYTTDAALAADELVQISIPETINSIATYPIAPLAKSAAPEVAQAFVDFVRSAEGQAILVTYGFLSY
ncbi:molybdate ABC transporter substrate-binding protein [Candidatus Oscillochloris fontis]|uniref:molybdate ABC transporter substrate-binding protein n=1 Tax=Candidatus Oscillochloris fontis TaxID=2496868 RepID=UPI00101CEE7E|nr:molybdate ABC transporter substrate-binding protein [Candidatus Oscillochloris fontis]